ncbi:substrate-binding domain-containing protein [Clostridium septicum]|uniref:LacI family transcriptional regulator n=1 Tax=Clostridium septicum TaxID=1504 RepID=A0A9N7JPU5_CLOSE|nr:substrate-binding domain-containing protein [Clostridium septicum]AYE35886.1 LacI family transcriptional regulator [Clostridium septicum]QAS60972.1 sugar ABC transporter substrate-binding protein [Clostridium septicum]UEC19750.1 substrate-binding domain-containing protein [Clostridium septicum]USS02189.1 substrate-binding domain-containing protein [Clostridium septicum]WLF70767.1 substrate-binding domain-containing protein [Clostridium septicum]
MKKKKKQILIIIFLLLILSFLFLISELLISGEKREVYNISIIVRGGNSESWMIMKQGAEQAASEMNVNISFITLSNENNVKDQKDLIEREIISGADAIVISPVDYEEMREPIEEAMKKVPVVLIESTINTKKDIHYISCNNYELGENLAEELMKMGNTRSKIAIMGRNLNSSSIKDRYKGFTDAIKKSKNTYDLLDISGNEEVIYNEAKNIIENNLSDVIVTFDPDVLEIVGKVKRDFMYAKKRNIGIEIYGSGITSKGISFLEENIINSIAVQNDFNIGYLGIKTAVDEIKGNNVKNKTIYSTIINTRTMYSDENQRLLFPFIR